MKSALFTQKLDPETPGNPMYLEDGTLVLHQLLVSD